jgi:predicted metal-binding membrane protein
VEGSSAFTPPVLERWRRRENLLPGLALIALAAAGWAYVAYQAASMGSMRGAVGGGMAMGSVEGIVVFLSAWTAMMVAMMVPATLPLILLYRTFARKRLGPTGARKGTAVMLAGYVAVWACAGATGVRLQRCPAPQAPWRQCCPPCCSSLAEPTSSRR